MAEVSIQTIVTGAVMDFVRLVSSLSSGASYEDATIP
jgi:hypothetical protein